MKIGMNLVAPVYFSRAWTFDNVIKMSRTWMFRGGTPEDKVPVFEDGYPDFSQIEDGQSVVTTIFSSAQGHYPGGYYLFFYRGQGNISFSSNVDVISNDGPFWVLDVDPSVGSITMFIDSSDPTDHIRDMILTPASEWSGSPYQKIYIDHVKRFDTVRVGALQGVVNITVAPDVNKRHVPNSVRYLGNGTGSSLPKGEDGVPIELLVTLANEAQVNPWFQMYHLFNEEYVRKFAQIVRDNLDPKLKARVEWSNEAWNSQFLVNSWVANEAERLGISTSEVIAQEIDRNWNIWLEEFAGQEDRIVKVIGAWNGNPSFAQDLLETGLVGDELAVAPYIGIPRNISSAYDSNTTVDQIFIDLNLAMPTVLERTAAHLQLAKQYNLKLVCYEGGQGLISQLPWREAAFAAQRDSRMVDLYRALIPALQALEMEVFCHFNDISDQTDSFGSSWGASEFQDEDGLKMLAILEFVPKAPNTPPWRPTGKRNVQSTKEDN